MAKRKSDARGEPPGMPLSPTSPLAKSASAQDSAALPRTIEDLGGDRSVRPLLVAPQTRNRNSLDWVANPRETKESRTHTAQEVQPFGHVVQAASGGIDLVVHRKAK